ncbi:MAG: hypothetical protein MUE68_06260 [Bacteroidetes bacterium]|jgi:hypothetical protein|nr:hypothetical protein [Bacteroidota bacterium]
MNAVIARSLLLLMVSAITLRASSDSGLVRIVSPSDGLLIYIDGRAVGTTPCDPVRWKAGRSVVQARRGAPYRWNAPSAAETVIVVANEVTEVRLNVPEPILLTSEGAQVEVRDRSGRMHSLPLWWPRDRLAELSIVTPDSVAIPPPGPGPVLTLNPQVGSSTPMVMKGPGTLGIRSETWTFASGAAMVISGVLAAVYRDKANDAAARYLQTRDPNALAEVRRYDRLAGASMVAVQVSLGAFVLFLAGP